MNTVTIWHLLWLMAVVIVIGLTAWALITTLRATDIMVIEKVIWSVILVISPPIGLIVWALVWFTRKRRRSAS